jgi:hypothetical protein
MAPIAADCNLLFGVLALQNGLINQGQLVAAFQAWTLDKGRALADHLVGRGDLDADDRSAVNALVARGSSPIRAKTCGSVLCAMLRGRLTGGESSTVGLDVHQDSIIVHHPGR